MTTVCQDEKPILGNLCNLLREFFLERRNRSLLVVESDDDNLEKKIDIIDQFRIHFKIVPNYVYDVYTFNNIVGQTSSTTADCQETTDQAEQVIPIYSQIKVANIATRKEPLYGTVCYASTKTRTLLDSGKTTTKWSTYNDTSLLNNGWSYTGAKKVVN